MKVTFTSPIAEEDITRTGITVDHIIIYPGNQVVLNNKGGSSRTLPISGLSKAAQTAFDVFVAALSGETNDEYVNGGVTARAIEAAKPIAEPVESPLVVPPPGKAQAAH